MVCIYPVDEQKKEYCFGIYDAKYYNIGFEEHKGRVRVTGQPGIADITKQYLYQLAFDDFIRKQGYSYVQNMFLCPQETKDTDYAQVRLDMLHQIGEKRLENIAIVKLCASEMYDLYLADKTIDREKMKEYIPIPEYYR